MFIRANILLFLYFVFGTEVIASSSNIEQIREEVAWYRAMPWPMEVEKEYRSDEQACSDMLLERELAKRFRKEFSITPDLLAQIRRTEHFYRYITFVRNNVISQDEPSPTEIKAYYESHKEEFAHPEMVQVQKVFIEFGETPTEETRKQARIKAQDVYERAVKGESFSKLVEEYSTIKDNDGIVGPFPKGRYNPVITETAFKLKPGEISKPFHTKYGYFVLKGIKKIPEGTTPFSEMESRLKVPLTREKRDQLKAELAEKAKQEFLVTVYDDRYTSANYLRNPDQPVIAGKDFAYTKRDFQDLYPNFRPDGTQESSQNFKRIVNMLLLDQVFQHSPGFSSRQTRAQLQFVESYYLAESYLKESSERQTFSESQIHQYYKEHHQAFLTPIERELRWIHVRIKTPPGASPADRHYAEVRAQKKAEEALEQLKKGQDFGQVARKFSDDPSSTSVGYLGWVREPFSAVIDTTAAELKPGEYSEVKKYKDAYIIVQLLDVKKRTPVPLAQVKTRILRMLRQEFAENIRKEIRQEIEHMCKSSQNLQ